MSLCHVDHYPFSCNDDTFHQSSVHNHHHHHHHEWCNAWFHSTCLQGQVSITNENGFELRIDVRHFEYDELNVKTQGDWVIVEGKISNDKKEQVCITKQFSRKYKLPRYYNANLTTSTLSSDGMLIVKVPPPENEPDNEEKMIEIEKVGPFNNSKKNSSEEKRSKSASKKDKNGNKEPTTSKNIEQPKEKPTEPNPSLNNVDTNITSEASDDTNDDGKKVE